MPMPWLTKSRFLSGLQCHKRLWFEVNEPLDEVTGPSTAILQGRAFDEFVQRYQPGLVVSRDKGMSAAIAETTRILQSGTPPAVLHQPAFEINGLAVIADVLRFRVNNGFNLIEVKATTQVKDTHVPDAAFQFLVLQGVGIDICRVFIAHVNNGFILRTQGDYAGLMVEEDITKQVVDYQPEAAAKAADFQQTMKSAVAPTIAVGAHCNLPYECPFMGRCTLAAGKRPDYPVETLPRGGKTLASLLNDGYRDLLGVPSERLTNDNHRRVHEATTSGIAYFDPAATTELRRLGYPRAYLDFETISFSVPEIIGTKPFEQLPFQWSVHVEFADADIRHFEYLAIESFGDFDALADALIAVFPAVGPIFAYNAGFEERVLRQLATRAPAHAQALISLGDRLVDLLPITRRAYYHRDMQGSWSIKNVMPTIAANLGYSELGEVQEGGAAQIAFLELRGKEVDPERATTLRDALLAYCRHDTWVMIILRRFLCGEPIAIEDCRSDTYTLSITHIVSDFP